MRRIFNVYLTSFLVLVGLMLLSSCESDLTIKTNVASRDCAVLTDDVYCIKVRNGQINSVKDLALVQDTILTSESSFNLSWKMPETAKGILATKIMLASDAACTEEVKSAEIELKEQVYTFTDIKDGIYYGCVFARARAAGLLAAKNNGIRIVVETALPQFESQSQVLYTNGRTLDKSLRIKSISAVSSQWAKISGPGELTFSASGAAVPTITASRDGSYTFSITAINEVGGKSTESFTLVYDSTPPVLKDIAPILTSAHSIAIKAESEEEDLRLYHWEIISAPGGATPKFRDANSATAELKLPHPGTYELKVSLSDQAGNIASTKVLVTQQVSAAPPVDTTNPTAPSAITVAAFTSTTSVSASYTAGTDANFSTHNVKACAASDCSTGCQGVSQDIASPVTLSSLVHGSSYYICLQSVDLSGNISAYVASSTSVTVDVTAPTAPSSLGFSGIFSPSSTLSLSFAVGTDANFSTHDVRLCSASDCITGCGSTIQSATSPVSLSGTTGTTYYGCARSLDLAGNASSWVASIGTMTIDSTNPTAPAAITIPALVGSNSLTATYIAGSDLNLATHNVKACTASDCSTGCLSVSQDLSSPVTVGSLIDGTAYFICMQTVDLATNTSAYVASGNSVTIDTLNPTAPSAIAWAGAYSNSTAAALSWTNGSDTNFFTHNLKACTDNECSTNCSSDTQITATPGSLTGLVDGSGYYACIQSVDLVGRTSAWIASAGIMNIDASAPGIPTAVSVPSDTNTNFAISFTAGSESNPGAYNIKACLTSAGCATNTGCVGATTTAVSPGTILATALTNGFSYYGCVQATDLASNASDWAASGGPVTYDTTAPQSPTISINADASYTTATSTTLTLGATGASQMYVTNTAGCASGGSWEAYATSKSWTLGQTNGAAAVYVQYKGATGNITACINDTIIHDNTAPNVATSIGFVSNYSSSTTATMAWSNGGSIDFSTNNIKICTDTGCSAGCVGATTNSGVSANISSLVNGSTYYGCVQSVDVLGNATSFVNSVGTVTIDTTAPGNPTAVSVPASTNGNISITFTPGSETNIGPYNIRACPIGACSSGTGCVGATTTASSPGSIASAALTNGTSYYGCVQARDLALNTSSWVASSGSITYQKTTVTYNGNSNTGGSVPSDSNTYSNGDTITVLGNTGPLTRTGYTFSSWNTLANGSGVNYSGDSTFAMGASSVTLYAKWIITPTYTVTYNSNSATSGSFPSDATAYYAGNTVNVASNSGYLVRTGYAFTGWNTAADGSGATYTAGGGTFAMGSANVILYAKWAQALAGTPAACSPGSIDSNGTLAGGDCISPAAASGGTVSLVSVNGITYRIHTFASSGTLDISTSGTVEAFLVAGGGAGGSYIGGGGGGGGIVQSLVTLASGSYTVTVGAGGASVANARGGKGGNSTFGGLIAEGGGGGGSNSAADQYAGGSGGNGGGATHNSSPGAAAAGGYAGGLSLHWSGQYGSGGGGGAGGAGTNGSSGGPGAGGAGRISDFSGTSQTYAAGGNGGTISRGGSGASTIGGGSGSESNASGSAGIVMIRYPVSASAACSTGSVYSRDASGGTCVSAPAGTPAHCDEGFIDSNGHLEGGACMSPAVASGGGVSLIVQNGVTYRVHTFSTDGTLDVSSLGAAEVLIVAGGGAGGTAGGGGGGLIQSPMALSPGSYTVTVGVGGASVVNARGGKGGNSIFGGLIAEGGGGGGSTASAIYNSGGSGGSSGGATAGGGTGAASWGGSSGGVTVSWGGSYGSGGGGGAGGAGTVGNNSPGAGGAGRTSDFSGTTQIYAAGGNGGTSNRGGIGAGTIGGGGGGSGHSGLGGDGSAGIVMIRYPVSASAACSTGSVYSGDASGGTCVSAPAGTPAQCDLGFIDSNGTLEGGACMSPAVASGGGVSLIVQNGVTYRVHTFSTDGTLDVSSLGAAEVLIVAGGGAGGTAGGGGGGVIQSTVALSPGSYAVTVGAGGASVVNVRGGKGGNSTFGGFIAEGGGGGGNTYSTTSQSGGSGGSSGGATNQGGGGASQFGSSGGVTVSWSGSYGSGGGGGAGGAGTVGNSSPGAGGAGRTSDFSGTTQTYAAGGNGGTANLGGRGAGTIGGGGGGGAHSILGGEGSAGIVMIRYPVSASAACPAGSVYSRDVSGGTCVSAPAGTPAQCDQGFIDSNGTLEGGACMSPAVASGGGVSLMVQNGVTYRVHAFASDGTLDVTSLGAAEVLIVAGGGGGGSGAGTTSAGGGGGGGVIQSMVALTPGSYAVTVGAGGASVVNARGGKGGNSSFASFIAEGGGGGGSNASADYNSGGSGGSSGGATNKGGGGASQSGRSGGAVVYWGGSYGSGGGGGAGGAGADGNSNAGAGGAGRTSDFSGTSQTYAAGGNGGTIPSVGSSASGYGGGGGGGSNTAAGSNGSGGVVMVRYPIP